ncbi:uncharacterized protein MONBRDRAFT_34283 [Monosiga brevicollis MX1]|uniref:Protein kinase domain-containing protein n=1 Tax=Monosiga brevicollis TaxID=81824 RepID=A9VAP7_MONBE|nr:uncharacterized protein MONBRDRAFT_34283 [Monosiga brevicollis MX1]EDQ85359.1 predicted protein [Monosiga brevicollis MX1]|eukprot:XP_001749770.1 hypothetical protein [Monosiga brevicollis MX1]
MLTNNQLTTLPPDFGVQTKLELVRLAMNKITEVPTSFWEAPALTWVGLASNPILGRYRHRQQLASAIDLEELSFGTLLGEGSSGRVFESLWNGSRVAVKLFKKTSTDGSFLDEMGLAASVHHPGLIHIHGIVHGGPEHGLVMEMLDGFQPLAHPPDAWNTVRCIYSEGQTFVASRAASLLTTVGQALHHLHENGIIHGDFYAHNVMYNSVTGDVRLGDFGAAWRTFALQPEQQARAQAFDTRAFCLLMQARPIVCVPPPSLYNLSALCQLCVSDESVRPHHMTLGSYLSSGGPRRLGQQGTSSSYKLHSCPTFHASSSSQSDCCL